VAKRGEEDHEFLASTDTWFRPVHLTIGPDGAIYVLDFYREVIETPLSLPDDIKKLAYPALGHRIILSAQARVKGLTPRQVVEETLQGVQVPGIRADGRLQARESARAAEGWSRYLQTKYPKANWAATKITPMRTRVTANWWSSAAVAAEAPWGNHQVFATKK